MTALPDPHTPAAQNVATPPLSEPARILVVDDEAPNRRLLGARLRQWGHEVLEACDGVQALAVAQAQRPDLILLDVVMPGLDGHGVCRQLRCLPEFQAVPIVMVTSLTATEDRVRGLEAGADDFLSKPLDKDELWARVRSLLRVKRLHDRTEQQRLQLAAWSQQLEQRVEEKLAEVARLSQLKRFFSPALASRLVAQGSADILHSHRREVTVLFADLRGFTAFAEHADAAEVMGMLKAFHQVVGEQIFLHQGTLERFTGDGLMVFFNDPDPQPDHALRAVKLALALREAVTPVLAAWQAHHGPAGLGLGLALGEATLGAIGFEGRLDYAAIGAVTNRAARLCAEAAPGEILACEAVMGVVLPAVEGVRRRLPPLRGLPDGLTAWQVLRLAAS